MDNSSTLRKCIRSNNCGDYICEQIEGFDELDGLEKASKIKRELLFNLHPDRNPGLKENLQEENL